LSGEKFKEERDEKRDENNGWLQTSKRASVFPAGTRTYLGGIKNASKGLGGFQFLTKEKKMALYSEEGGNSNFPRMEKGQRCRGKNPFREEDRKKKKKRSLHPLWEKGVQQTKRPIREI